MGEPWGPKDVSEQANGAKLGDVAGRGKKKPKPNKTKSTNGRD